MKRTLTLAGITLMAMPLAAYGQDRHHRGDRHHGGHFENILETYDANADGQVTQEEVDAFRADRLAEFDANGDGSLSLQEYEALWLDAYRDRMVDNFQRHDDDGDGAVTIEEFGEDQARLVQRMDRNDDGVIDDADKSRRSARKSSE